LDVTVFVIVLCMKAAPKNHPVEHKSYLHKRFI